MTKQYLWLLLVLIFSCVSNDKKEKTGEESPAPTEKSSSAVTNYQLTAREAFRLAKKEVKKWDKNAKLVEISTYPSSPKAEGTCAGWKFEFNSTSKNQRLEVLVRRGKVSQTDEGKLLKNEPVSGEWMDSDKIADIGREYLDYSNSKLWLGMASYDGAPAWNIRARNNDGKTKWVRINALNGEMIKSW